MLERMVDRLLGRGSAERFDSSRKSPAGRLFAAVTVVPGTSCCNAVRKLRTRRTLVDAAPRLPLPNCTQPWRCECTYEKHADRRAKPAGDRRVTGLWQPNLWKDGSERRKSKGRRSTDR